MAQAPPNSPRPGRQMLKHPSTQLILKASLLLRPIKRCPPTNSQALNPGAEARANSALPRRDYPTDPSTQLVLNMMAQVNGTSTTRGRVLSNGPAVRDLWLLILFAIRIRAIRQRHVVKAASTPRRRHHTSRALPHRALWRSILSLLASILLRTIRPDTIGLHNKRPRLLESVTRFATFRLTNKQYLLVRKSFNVAKRRICTTVISLKTKRSFPHLLMYYFYYRILRGTNNRCVCDL